MASAGTYRIQSTLLNKSFEAPENTQWNEQEIVSGLNAIPINSQYKIHIWSFENLEKCDYEDLATLFETQQDNNSQLVEVETDPYSADSDDESYVTTVYTDFIIQNIAPRTRGLPFYDNVTVTFEIFVA